MKGPCHVQLAIFFIFMAGEFQSQNFNVLIPNPFCLQTERVAAATLFPETVKMNLQLLKFIDRGPEKSYNLRSLTLVLSLQSLEVLYPYHHTSDVSG